VYVSLTPLHSQLHLTHRIALVKAILDFRPEIVTTQHTNAEGKPCRVVILYKAPLFYASGNVARRDFEELPMVLKGSSGAVTYKELLDKMHEYWHCRLVKPHGELDRFLQESGHYLKKVDKKVDFSDIPDDETKNCNCKEIEKDTEAKNKEHKDGSDTKPTLDIPFSAITVPDFEEWAKQRNAPDSTFSGTELRELWEGLGYTPKSAVPMSATEWVKYWSQSKTPKSAVPMSAMTVPDFEEWTKQDNEPNSATSFPFRPELWAELRKSALEESNTPTSAAPLSAISIPNFEEWAKQRNGPSSAIAFPFRPKVWDELRRSALEGSSTPTSAAPVSAISIPNLEEWATQSNGPNSAISFPFGPEAWAELRKYAISGPNLEENEPDSAISIREHEKEESYTPKSTPPVSAIPLLCNFEEWAKHAFPARETEDGTKRSNVKSDNVEETGAKPYVATLEDWVKRNENVLVPVSTRALTVETTVGSTPQDTEDSTPDSLPELVPL
jgi:hypothetical protein